MVIIRPTPKSNGYNSIHGRFSSSESGTGTGRSWLGLPSPEPSSPSSLLASLRKTLRTQLSFRGTRGVA
ncbi:hypothetical protein Prudu_016059 [Prunus dulcis]|uniref:Uncharacterized protein n=1 Tax=Prunus dulcis TaxID=3755 RepID=A0A4Y1RLR7_PRUDU|nr:hypothetical protein Prudu_016059 [Prunus dulcis]